jgi:hypothetical protein
MGSAKNRVAFTWQFLKHFKRNNQNIAFPKKWQTCSTNPHHLDRNKKSFTSEIAITRLQHRNHHAIQKRKRIRKVQGIMPINIYRIIKIDRKHTKVL